jgi:coenzyme F420-reducing hydrogenase beta subunit
LGETKTGGNSKKEDYIFFYTNRDSQVRDFWNIGYKKNGLKSHVLSSTVGIKDFIDKDTSVRVAMAPADFLNEIADAKLVVTASFHCVAFSILFHKQFVVFLTGNRGKDERILNLLHICGLESRIITSKTIADDIEDPIDYGVVDKRLQPYLDYSREYLRRAVYSLPDVEDLDFPNGESEYFCDDERCTGCMACAAVCPVNAIEIKRDDEGFLVPSRDASRCISCYKCHDACQVYKPLQKERDITQQYYAVKNKDEVRRLSSSGGVFTALSDAILNRGGVICAASMGEDFKVKHVFATTKQERDLMRKTLYVQSDISKVYEKIRSHLAEQVPVLFVGTPCQVAGLYNGLSDSILNFLYTCDIVCHGVPSPGVYDSFIAYLRDWKGTLDEFNFRDKEIGWKHGYTVSAVFDGKKIINKPEIQSFNKMFSRNIINRQSCANCLYTNYDRVGDVTIGDCWELNNSCPTL